MELFVGIFDYLLKNGTSKYVILAFLISAGFGITVFYLLKSINYIHTNMKGNEEFIALTKTLEDIKISIKDIKIPDNSEMLELERTIEGIVSRISSITEKIEEIQNQERALDTAARKDLQDLSDDVRVQSREILNHIQTLQKDLASLQGTIIGMNSSRSRLK